MSSRDPNRSSYGSPEDREYHSHCHGHYEGCEPHHGQGHREDCEQHRGTPVTGLRHRLEGPPPGYREVEIVPRLPLISSYLAPHASRNRAREQSYCSPHPDPHRSQNLTAGQSHQYLEPMHTHYLQYNSTEDKEPEQRRRSSKACHPSGMGVEWMIEQAARAAREVEENLEEERRAERAERRAAERRAAITAASEHSNGASGQHYYHAAVPSPVALSHTHGAQQRYLEEQARGEHGRRRR
ncbi:hypothetical protein EV426DRAFT_712951 [Tirmania nivea]|nr:hypothetical protein EV426DRAFT_712951 [Tirmania nivea]